MTDTWAETEFKNLDDKRIQKRATYSINRVCHVKLNLILS